MPDSQDVNSQILNPEVIAEKGEQIYKEKLSHKLEKTHKGKYVAIDVETEEYFLGKSPEEALEKATKKFPNKIFHLIRIGYQGVYQVSWSAGSKGYGWIF